jgi:hypothetical protein
MNDGAPLTITVPEAGKKYFNLSRDASYAAAQRGDIPTIRVGRLLRVPTAAMEAKLKQVGDWEQIGDAAKRVVAAFGGRWQNLNDRRPAQSDGHVAPTRRPPCPNKRTPGSAMVDCAR